MQNELQVTKLNIAPNAPIEKSINNAGRACFMVRGTFTLADGRTVPTRVTSERKKNLATAIQREHESIAAGSMTHDPLSGMTTTRFTIGARGLQPSGIRLSDAIAASNAKNGCGLDVATAGVRANGTRFSEADCGGVLGADNHVYSDADPGL